MTNNNITAEIERVRNEPQSTQSDDLLIDNYAAIDLGSNSFHMVVARYQQGEFVVLDRQREVVRLAAGLDDNNFLSEEVKQRALHCLKQFAQLIRNIPESHVRVVGTNALRRLQNKNDFLLAAEKALGHSIEIIAGREEARLIYLGVSKWSSASNEPRMVIDIGGGSTEVIVGQGDTPLCRESLEVGCVVQTKKFFADGVINEGRFEQARLAAELAIRPVVKQFKKHGWEGVIGCSGTMKSIAQLLLLNGWSKDGIQKQGLERLVKTALSFDSIEDLEIVGLSEDRQPVFIGGLSVLVALFEQFSINEMSISEIALREGVLYDLVGRSGAGDVRYVTINAILNRWAVDIRHGERVKKTALNLYSQIDMQWDIQDNYFQDMLSWATLLHELGLLIGHDGYQKHGAYVVANADLAGFARRDQLLLSALVEGHRRKFPLDLFEHLPSVLVTPAKRIAVILRLAVLLHRGRASNIPKDISAKVQGQHIKLKFEPEWLQENPLTLADLAQERLWLKTIGVKLSYS